MTDPKATEAMVDAPAAAATAATPPPSSRAKEQKPHDDPAMAGVCAQFMNKKKCNDENCKLAHDSKLCYHYWKGICRFGDECRRSHTVNASGAPNQGEKATNFKASGAKTERAKKSKAAKKDKIEGQKSEEEKESERTRKPKASKKDTKKDLPETEKTGAEKESGKGNKRDNKRPKVRRPKRNTESWNPNIAPADLRVVYDLGGTKQKFSTEVTTRDVLLAPNVFSDFKKGEIYDRLVKEIESCGIPSETLLKMWHGNDKIDGTHLIADDKTAWKKKCPTFDLVIDRLRKFFSMDIKATRFNWYKDTEQWKPFHHDAAAVKPEKAAVQNFTVAISFGATRDAAFEHAETKTVISIPQPDGCVYAFSRDTNVIWRHGILQDMPIRQEGRISVIAWGWIDGMKEVDDSTQEEAESS
ncbi:TPA: hypothetical protein N0F65_004268 [Lagenidium giganteum]|uniref:C3H1-type domain-containing protein n=1 Tax=Lagenidium giganteum TaxID=4803 RepID=A0AAV2ZJK2_9STRA|nr:TPA: hypothetical protein N0F65_004268 [Lagenidium giganteum]